MVSIYRICRNKRPPRNKRPSKTVIFQRGEYTKPMDFDGWFFIGGSTQNRWLLMGDSSKGGVHKTDGSWWVMFSKGGVHKTDGSWWVMFSKGGVHKTDGYWWGIFQRGEYTKPMGIDGGFFKGGGVHKTDGFWWVIFQRGGGVHKTDGFWWGFFIALKNQAPGAFISADMVLIWSIINFSQNAIIKYVLSLMFPSKMLNRTQPVILPCFREIHHPMRKWRKSWVFRFSFQTY